jgi:hypothetical protein
VFGLDSVGWLDYQIAVRVISDLSGVKLVAVQIAAVRLERDLRALKKKRMQKKLFEILREIPM